MERNSIIGFLLLIVLFFIYITINAPSQEEIEKSKREAAQKKALASTQDSLDLLKAKSIPSTTTSTLPDSLQVKQNAQGFGSLANASVGTETTHVLENDFLKITFSNKGGSIKAVDVKKYQKAYLGKDNEELKTTLQLLEDAKNKFEYLLPIPNVSNQSVSTANLFFTASQPDNKSITFTVKGENGLFFEQKYQLQGDYVVNYDIRYDKIGVADKPITLNWVNYLDKIEINHKYERNYSTVYVKPSNDDPDYCSCTSDDETNIDKAPIKWVSHTQQFFNATLMAKDAFAAVQAKTSVLPVENEDLKKLETNFSIPNKTGEQSFAMRWYLGPNEFDRLRAFGENLEDVIPFGSSILGTINRWVVRPIFNLLLGFIGTKGIVILLLTLIVKLLLFPLTYKMLQSQAKMGALKPEIEKIKEKAKGDMQVQQMEQMKLYRESGVNPLGGCMPLVLQMPIWFALYRFFPAAIEFRQASFLWATDLSSYDVFANLSFAIPFYGSHISMFNLLWVITTLIYTYYNSKNMDYSQQPAMQYLQYIMPVFFLFFFNNVASGLTVYMLFSNILNIAQTLIGRNYLFNEEKMRAELEANRKNPKKKSGFQERLEQAMNEQKRIAQEREKKK